MNRTEANQRYGQLIADAQEQGGPAAVKVMLRCLATSDLFFLLTKVLRRKDADNDWCYARCNEVQEEPDGYLDLWAREHYKSTIITFALTIQNILEDPNITVGIFSHTRPIAKAFLRQIKREFENNKILLDLFPDVVWEQPHRDSPKWSEDEGIIVKRSANPKEATVEAWGLVDGQPVSKHYKLMVYDDVVTRESVTNPEMVQKVTKAWEESRSLTISDGSGKTRCMGTRWHFADTYRDIIKKGSVKVRLYTEVDDMGNLVLWSPETQLEKRRDMGPYVYACHAKGTKILMADWTEKPIDEVKAGDKVVGFDFGFERGDSPQGRTRLVESLVTGVLVRRGKLNTYHLASGHTVTCTPDHKWWTGRGTKDRNLYSPLLDEATYPRLGGLVRMFDPIPELGGDTLLNRSASYLGGIFDGEGSFSNKTVHLHQSRLANPLVCESIRFHLSLLGFEWGEVESRVGKVDFFLKGGKTEVHRFLSWCQPIKGKKLLSSLFDMRNGSSKNQDKVITIDKGGEEEVFNIQTTTGNYIAGGYGSKNCQIKQDPKMDSVEGFKTEWLQYWPADSAQGMNVYILCDPAGEKKKENDYTVFWVVGANSDENYYILDVVRDRLNLTERGDILFSLHKKYRKVSLSVKVGYEKVGMQSDIEHYEDRMRREGYRFRIIPIPAAIGKSDRIKKLIPLFEQGRIYLPEKIVKVDYEGNKVDLVRAFVAEEYEWFPFPVHDDMLDSLAKITEKALGVSFPDEMSIPESSKYTYSHFQRVQSENLGYDPLHYGLH